MIFSSSSPVRTTNIFKAELAGDIATQPGLDCNAIELPMKLKEHFKDRVTLPKNNYLTSNERERQWSNLFPTANIIINEIGVKSRSISSMHLSSVFQSPKEMPPFEFRPSH